MKRFEYKVMEKWASGFKAEKKLNELGAEGWELVAINSVGNTISHTSHYVFKREVGQQ